MVVFSGEQHEPEGYGHQEVPKQFQGSQGSRTTYQVGNSGFWLFPWLHLDLDTTEWLIVVEFKLVTQVGGSLSTKLLDLGPRY